MHTLTPYEALLGKDTMDEILRRYPDETFDRNLTDPHPFVMCSYTLHVKRVGFSDPPKPGVRVGW